MSITLSNSNVILAKNFDPAQVSFGEPRQLDNGGRSVSIMYGNKPFSVQTPQMRTPFGLNRYRVTPTTPVAQEKVSIDLSFDNMDEKTAIKSFFDMIQTLDKMTINFGAANSFTLFKARHSPDIVSALYTPMIKYAKDKKTGEVSSRFPPTFKITVPHKEGVVSCDTYDAKRNKVDMASIEKQTKDSSVTAIAQCAAVWVVGGKFGVTWRAQQLRVVVSSNLNGYAFVDTGDDIQEDEDDDKTLSVPANAHKQKPKSAAVKTAAVKRGLAIQDSDDETSPIPTTAPALRTR